MEKSTKQFWLITLLVGLAMAALAHYQVSRPVPRFEQPMVLTGTYCTGNAALPHADAEYLAFMKDGEYWHYRQFELLERGSYSPGQDEALFRLTPQGGGPVSTAVWTGEKLYRVDSAGGVTVFLKFTDVPTLINVEEDY